MKTGALIKEGADMKKEQPENKKELLEINNMIAKIRCDEDWKKWKEKDERLGGAIRKFAVGGVKRWGEMIKSVTENVQSY